MIKNSQFLHTPQKCHFLGTLKTLSSLPFFGTLDGKFAKTPFFGVLWDHKLMPKTHFLPILEHIVHGIYAISSKKGQKMGLLIPVQVPQI